MMTWNPSEFKTFCSAKDPVTKVRRQAMDCEQISANHANKQNTRNATIEHTLPSARGISPKNAHRWMFPREVMVILIGH